ncbi:MAG TPA: type II toxin-antitoxin system Phd/YefM family antitoxin [Anaerolineae bacterium]
MDKRIGVAKARSSLSEIVEQVQFRGNAYIINRNGKPAAAVVPIDVYENWKRQRRAFFDSVREMQKRVRLPARAADRLASEAARSARRGSKR